MTLQDFDEVLGLIQDDIIKTNTNMRDSIPANKISRNNTAFVQKYICP